MSATMIIVSFEQQQYLFIFLISKSSQKSSITDTQIIKIPHFEYLGHFLSFILLVLWCGCRGDSEWGRSRN